jgi:hypothetical protein
MATATKDPIAALAHHNAVKQQQLLASLTESQQEIVQKIIGKETATPASAGVVTIKEITPAPPMTWCLIGLDTMRWNLVSSQIEAIASNVPDALIEIVSNGDSH